MNTKAIREALELAREVLWDSVSNLDEVDAIMRTDDAGESEALEMAETLAGEHLDCEALVAVCDALKELDGEEAKP